MFAFQDVDGSSFRWLKALSAYAVHAPKAQRSESPCGQCDGLSLDGGAHFSPPSTRFVPIPERLYPCDHPTTIFAGPMRLDSIGEPNESSEGCQRDGGGEHIDHAPVSHPERSVAIRGPPVIGPY